MNNQTFLALIALKDPLRPNIKDSLGYAPLSGITLRMCSGDNLDTAKAVAVDAGILTEEEVNNVAEKHAMNATEFREMVGDVVRTRGEVEYGDESTITYSLTN